MGLPGTIGGSSGIGAFGSIGFVPTVLPGEGDGLGVGDVDGDAVGDGDGLAPGSVDGGSGSSAGGSLGRRTGISFSASPDACDRDLTLASDATSTTPHPTNGIISAVATKRPRIKVDPAVLSKIMRKIASPSSPPPNRNQPKKL